MIVEEIFDIIQRLNSEERVSVLLAEQNAHLVLRYADHGVVLENGRGTGPPGKIDVGHGHGIPELAWAGIGGLVLVPR